MRPSGVACIVGPTAVGKSDVAEGVALRLSSEVVSVDALQVYRGMDVGTAKTPLESRRVALHMVDVAEVTEDYSAARFQADARACIDLLLGTCRTPVLCGGTGLYLDAVIDEMSFPHGDNGTARRARYEALCAELGPSGLHALLAERDPQSAQLIHPNNSRRVIRALELLDEGTSYARHHAGLHSRRPHYEARIWALVLPRDELYRRIERRVGAMFAQGLVEEVRRLDAAGLRRSRTASQAIGYKEVLQYLDGQLPYEEAVELVCRNTRRLAKRQLSWIRRDGRAQVLDLSGMSHGEAADLIAQEVRSWNGDGD